MDLFDEQKNKKVTGGPITGYSLKVIFPEKQKKDFKIVLVLLLVISIVGLVIYGGYKTKELVEKKKIEKELLYRKESERQNRIQKAVEDSNSEVDKQVKVNKRVPKSIPDFDNKMDKLINGKTKDIYLVFAGGIKEKTNEKLELLKNENINASFFTVGSNVVGNNDIVKKMYQDGHYIGVTGNNEDYLNIYSSAQNVSQSVLNSKNNLKNVLGDYEAKLALIPGPLLVPRFNPLKEQAKEILNKNDINTIKYNQYASIDEEDTDLKRSLDSKIELERTVVLLVYESAYDNINVLKNIIQKFKDAKYSFKTFYDLEEESKTEKITNITELR